MPFGNYKLRIETVDGQAANLVVNLPITTYQMSELMDEQYCTHGEVVLKYLEFPKTKRRASGYLRFPNFKIEVPDYTPAASTNESVTSSSEDETDGASSESEEELEQSTRKRKRTPESAPPVTAKKTRQSPQTVEGDQSSAIRTEDSPSSSTTMATQKLALAVAQARQFLYYCGPLVGEDVPSTSGDERTRQQTSTPTDHRDTKARVGSGGSKSMDLASAWTGMG